MSGAEAWTSSGLESATMLLGDEMPEEVRRSPASPLRYQVATLLAELNRLVLEADAPAADLARAAELLEQAEALLASHPRRRPHRWEASALSGRFNALAPPLHVERSPDPSVFRCRAVLGVGWGGPDGLVHGGVLAKVMDMCFGAAAGLHGTPGVTGTLTVRYQHPTPLGVDLLFESWVERTDGRKVLVAGRVLCDRVETVAASGVMIRARGDEVRATGATTTGSP